MFFLPFRGWRARGVTHRRIVAADLGADPGVDQAAREAEAVHDDPAVDLRRRSSGSAS